MCALANQNRYRNNISRTLTSEQVFRRVGVVETKRLRADTVAGASVVAVLIVGGVLAWRAYQQHRAFERVGTSMGTVHGTSPLSEPVFGGGSRRGGAVFECQCSGSPASATAATASSWDLWNRHPSQRRGLVFDSVWLDYNFRILHQFLIVWVSIAVGPPFTTWCRTQSYSPQMVPTRITLRSMEP